MTPFRYCYRSSANSAHTIYANDLNLKITYVFDAVYDTKNNYKSLVFKDKIDN